MCGARGARIGESSNAVPAPVGRPACRIDAVRHVEHGHAHRRFARAGAASAESGRITSSNGKARVAPSPLRTVRREIELEFMEFGGVSLWNWRVRRGLKVGFRGTTITKREAARDLQNERLRTITILRHGLRDLPHREPIAGLNRAAERIAQHLLGEIAQELVLCVRAATS